MELPPNLCEEKGKQFQPTESLFVTPLAPDAGGSARERKLPLTSPWSVEIASAGPFLAISDSSWVAIWRTKDVCFLVPPLLLSYHCFNCHQDPNRRCTASSYVCSIECSSFGNERIIKLYDASNVYSL